jgi:hypothetical protein
MSELPPNLQSGGRRGFAALLLSADRASANSLLPATVAELERLEGGRQPQRRHPARASDRGHRSGPRQAGPPVQAPPGHSSSCGGLPANGFELAIRSLSGGDEHGPRRLRERRFILPGTGPRRGSYSWIWGEIEMGYAAASHAPA